MMQTQLHYSKYYKQKEWDSSSLGKELKIDPEIEQVIFHWIN